ncbi:hypothetical protein V8G54_025587 [Vigna mungo]|uniref:Uncharacterized protein n=1 Tax=Vigna mungo TaxID=3915 RepID=A0AAQ3MYP7_VIGMU
MLLGTRLNSKFVAFLTSSVVLSKIHPTAANISYSRLASSSISGRLDEHQQDKKSPWESEIIAVRTLVWNHKQRKQSNFLWLIVIYLINQVKYHKVAVINEKIKQVVHNILSLIKFRVVLQTKQNDVYTT